MPFLGQDWRSNGEQWVRTSDGWERLTLWRLKLLENLNENVVTRLLKLTNEEDWLNHLYADTRGSQPYVYVLLRLSKELKMQASIAEALKRLDMTGAAKDMRRCTYVAKLLEFLIQQKLCTLSGAAQKIVFTIMEELLNQAVKTHNGIHVCERLIKESQGALQRGHYDHVGSSSLWQCHGDSLDRMQNTLNGIKLKEREDDDKLTISDLPDECIRQILLRFDDHQDLARAGLTETRTFSIAQDQQLWRRLCLYHFTNQQWHAVIRKGESMDTLPWHTLYLRLRKRFGLKDVYAEMLHLCRHCNALYWEHHGHPCLMSNLPPKSIPVSPAMCVQLFTS